MRPVVFEWNDPTPCVPDRKMRLVLEKGNWRYERVSHHIVATVKNVNRDFARREINKHCGKKYKVR